MAILDAGTGIRNLGLSLAEEALRGALPLRMHIFLSHTHWDHIQGLPFFQPAYSRETRMTIYGSPKKERFLASVLEGQMDSEYFPVAMSAFAADINIREISQTDIQLGPFVVDWEEQIFHPGGSVRYRFTVEDKKIVYATDVELDRIFSPEENGAEARRYAEEYIAFIREADLLIADGQYTEEEYAEKRGWGHSSIGVLLEAAAEAQVKQVAIFHHDPQHSDKFIDELWKENRARYRASDWKMDIFWAREGLTLAL
jgi:phosphoribosyl 1,2-cyclic phosphodiesterase